MHPSYFLIALLVLVALTIVAFCLWLSLKIFGIKPSRGNLIKIIGSQAIFAALASLISSIAGGGIGASFNLLSLLGGGVLWVVLIKHFAKSGYSIGRAIGSYITSYIFAIGLSLVAAIIGIAFFAQVYKIDGDSMAPALNANQTVLVYKFAKQPKNNDIVVYRNSKGTQALGRVHGTPGQSVPISSGVVEVDGISQKTASFTLGEDQYYVTADNTAYNIPPRVISGDSIVGTIGPKL